MRARLAVLSVVFALSIVPAGADDYVDWSGPGWYITDSVSIATYSFISGPYSSEADCNAALAPFQSANQNTPGHMDGTCDYYAKNPYGS